MGAPLIITASRTVVIIGEASKVAEVFESLGLGTLGKFKKNSCHLSISDNGSTTDPVKTKFDLRG